MKKIIAIILFGVIATATGCGTPDNQDNKITIYTSIYPIQYAVDRIGSDTVHVESIYPPGVDAHTYEPTMKIMTAIAESDAFIYMGAGMEGFAESIANAIKSESVKLIELGKNEELFHMEHKHHHEDDGHHHGGHDPHIWLDPVRMIDMARIIKEALIEMNPDKSRFYTENFVSLKKDLLTLDQRFKKTLQAKENKRILVSHAAYNYWEERYGIEQIAIKGLSSSDEPSQKDLVSIIEQAKKYDLEYIIFEQNTSNRVSKIIQEQIGANVLRLHNLAVLTEKDIKNNENYFTLMKHNLMVLEKATN